MKRAGKPFCTLISCVLLLPMAAHAAKHGPDITLEQLETIQTVSLQTEEYAPFTLRAEAPGQFKLSGLPTSLQSYQNERVTPQQHICASIRDTADDADADLIEVLSKALEFDYCADTPS